MAVDVLLDLSAGLISSNKTPSIRKRFFLLKFILLIIFCFDILDNKHHIQFF